MHFAAGLQQIRLRQLGGIKSLQHAHMRFF
jgi:hypothetical protein